MRRFLSILLGLFGCGCTLVGLALLTRDRWWAAVVSVWPPLRPYAAPFGLVNPQLTLLVTLAGAPLVLGALCLRSSGQGRGYGVTRPLLLRRVVQGELLQRCSDRGYGKWIPRMSDPPAYLVQHPRILLIGSNGAGKTREALELVRACASETSLAEHLLVPNWGSAFDWASSEELEQALTGLGIIDGAAVLWLDELQRHLTNESAARLSELIALLEKRVRLHIVGTMPMDPQTPWERRWLQDWHIELVTLPDMPSPLIQRLITQSAEQWDMTLNQTQLSMLGAYPDHRPEQVHSLLRCLLDRDQAVPTDEQVAQALGMDVQQRWQEDCQAMLAAAPAVAALLQVLAVWYGAGQVPNRGLVKLLAAEKLRWYQRPGLRRAQRVLLKHPYLTLEGRDYLINGIVLEGFVQAGYTSEQALDELRRFLGRCMATPGGAAQRAALQEMAVGLGRALESNGAYESAMLQYARALTLDAHCAPAQHAWGRVLGIQAQQLSAAGQQAEALAALEQACTHYAEAAALKPSLGEIQADWAETLALRAMQLAQQGQKQAALQTWREADTRYAAAAVGHAAPNAAALLAARGAFLDLEAQFLAENSYRREAFAVWREAGVCFTKATQLRAAYVEAHIAWGQALEHQAGLAARSHGSDQALNSYAQAMAQFAQALALAGDGSPLLCDIHSAWGAALLHEGQVLAERGRNEQALDILRQALPHYAAAVAATPRTTGDGAPSAQKQLDYEWGRALAECARLLATAGQHEQALATWLEADQHLAKSLPLPAGGTNGRVTASAVWAERVEIITRRARLLAQMGRRREAASTLAQAEPHYVRLAELQTAPQVQRAWAGLLHERGRLLAETRRRDEALTALQEANQRYAAAAELQADSIEILLPWAQSLSLRGQLLTQGGRDEEALEALTEAVTHLAACAADATHKLSYAILYGWGDALDLQAQLLAGASRPQEALWAWSEADEAYTRAIEAEPANPELQSTALVARGNALYNRAHFALQNRPQHETQDGASMALAIWQQGDHCYERATELASDRRAMVYAWANKLNTRAQSLTGAGAIQQAMQAWQAADRCHNAAITGAPDDATGLNGWGNALYERAQSLNECDCREQALAAWREAILCYDRAALLNGSLFEAQYNRTSALAQCGWMLIRLGRFEEGLQDLQRSNTMRASLITTRPLDDWDHYRLAYVALTQHDQHTAQEHLQLAIKGTRLDLAHKPDNLRRSLDLALYLLALGDTNAAQEILRQVVAQGPTPGQRHQAHDDILALAALYGDDHVRETLALLSKAL